MTAQQNPDVWAQLRAPFPPEQIHKLPRATRRDNQKGKCTECGGWHGLPAVHLDYVGHAEVTDRLLKVDPTWTWEPIAFDERGLPAFVYNGSAPVGLWIRLTVCGVTRIGYGSVEPGVFDAEKQLIGDCLLRGTNITTDRGTVAIEDVRPGDRVPTRNGWQTVTDHWLSEPSAPVVAVLIEGGRALVGTPHHRIPTTQGVRTLGTLRAGDKVLAWQGIDDWQEQKRSNGEVGATGGTRTIPHTTGKRTSWPLPRLAPIYTGISTRSTTAASPMGGTSTTSTTTRAITGRTTSLLSHRKNTLPFTAMSVPMPNSLARNVRAHSVRFVDGHGGARLRVRNASEGAQALPTSARPKNPCENQERVKNAEPGSPLGSRGRGFVPVRVVASLGVEPGEVWNLSVGEAHEYVANGILVHNSIRNAAMRFGVALDLWAKSDLHTETFHDDPPVRPTPAPAERRQRLADAARELGATPVESPAPATKRGEPNHYLAVTHLMASERVTSADLRAVLGDFSRAAVNDWIEAEPGRTPESLILAAQRKRQGGADADYA